MKDHNKVQKLIKSKTSYGKSNVNMIVILETFTHIIQLKLGIEH